MTKDYIKRQFSNFYNEVIKTKTSKNVIVMPKYDTPQEMRSSGVIDKPIAVLTFDGWDENTIEKIAPYLYEKGIPFTVFAGFNDSKIGSADFMTNSRLQAYHTLKDYGGEVQLYTSQPKTTFEGTSNYEEQYTQLMQAYDRFISWGFGKPRFCSLAGGVTSDILNNLLHGLNIKSARTTTNHDNVTTELFEYPSIYCTNKTFHNFPQTLNGWANLNIPTFAMAHGLLNDTIWNDENTFISEENMKSMIDDLASLKTSKNVTFMKYSEFWDYIHFPRTAEIGQHCLIWEGDKKQHEYVKTVDGWREITIS